MILMSRLTRGGFQFGGRTGFDEFNQEMVGFEQSSQGRQMGVRSTAACGAIHKHKNGEIAWDKGRFCTGGHILKRIIRAYIGRVDIRKIWCRRGESNPRPRDYETLALPLSYAGTKVMVIPNAMESPGSVSRRPASKPIFRKKASKPFEP